MWEIRKVWVVRVGMSVAYCGDSHGAAERASCKSDGPSKVFEAMVAVRFAPDGKVEEVQYLAECMRPDFPDPLDGAEIDIARGT